ncbi:MAG: hypothetical protein M1822_004829 [Bathelium mastoideum]|nr:MAG: hypothetical protein M1822_004829 [Bathelium mastoideum]
MGIPYSREINSAFEQVTPLVAAAYELLSTIKNIAILLAFIQILTVILLTFILVSLLGLLYTLNPDLAAERQQLVTPVMRWLAGWIHEFGETAKWFLRALLVLVLLGSGISLWQGSLAGSRAPGPNRDGEEDRKSDENEDKKTNQDSDGKPDNE